MENLILVDENDVEIGLGEKINVHLKKGMRHRAFSVFLINSEGNVYVQQRSKEKLLWPMHWSNSCCSHPRFGEDINQAVTRRVEEELGIKLSSSPSFLYKFWYESVYLDVGFENEICHVYFVISDEIPSHNPEELNSGIYIHYSKLQDVFFNSKNKFTPWFKMEWNEILNNHLYKIEAALKHLS